jgi:hypothetical protein
MCIQPVFFFLHASRLVIVRHELESLTRHVSYLHASYAPLTYTPRTCTPLTRLLHASYTPLTRFSYTPLVLSSSGTNWNLKGVRDSGWCQVLSLLDLLVQKYKY